MQPARQGWLLSRNLISSGETARLQWVRSRRSLCSIFRKKHLPAGVVLRPITSRHQLDFVEMRVLQRIIYRLQFVCTGASMTLPTVFGPRCSSVPPEHRSAIEMKELSRIVTVSAGHYPIRSSQPL